MYQQVIEKRAATCSIQRQNTVGTDHRPAYGPDGDYRSPNVESIFEAVYDDDEVDPSATDVLSPTGGLSRYNTSAF
jgi:hypothetical protein